MNFAHWRQVDDEVTLREAMLPHCVNATTYAAELKLHRNTRTIHDNRSESMLRVNPSEVMPSVWRHWIRGKGKG